MTDFGKVKKELTERFEKIQAESVILEQKLQENGIEMTKLQGAYREIEKLEVESTKPLKQIKSS